MANHIFTGMQMFSAQQWLSGQAVVVEEGKIRAMIATEMVKNHQPATVIELPADHYLVPGFIDLHIHGANGADVMDGTPEAFSVMGRALAAEGVTGYLATTMTASPDQIEKVLLSVAAAMDTPDEKAAAILGVHLEGPFISKDKAGAQQDASMMIPRLNVVDAWQKASNNIIKLVTLAPELPDIVPFIEGLKKSGILVSAGHTNATYAETEAAITAGCAQGTHLFNAMRAIQQREPGVAMALLLAPHVSVELIADGIHLHPAMLSMALKLKGNTRVLLVTDAMRAKCLGDGSYELGGQSVTVQAGKAMTQDGVLAGSTLTMPAAIRNMVNFTGCSLLEAVAMASTNPATRLGLSDRKGQIMSGYDADLVVLDAAFNVKMTMRHGQIIYPA